MMPARIPAVCLAFATASFAASLEAEAKSAAQKSVALIQRINAQWKTPCVSCHHQVLGALALEAARSHGIAVDEKLAQAAGVRDFKLLLDLDAALRVDQLIDPAMSEGSMLLGAHAAGAKPSLVTAAYARHIARNQLPDGRWPLFDNRPPHSHSGISAAAIAVRAISLYHPAPGPFVESARQWLGNAKPADTEGAAFQLLGLHWSGATAEPVRRAATHLAGLQRPDGSWAQRPGAGESDAYSTAEALYALRVAGSWSSHEDRFERGIRWLLSHQAADGSWRVKTGLHSKAPISPPYFESGFPYGHDQFLSIAATAWAVRALAEALPEGPNPPAPLPLPTFDDAKFAWVRTAMFGTPAEVAKLDPKAATREGATALMIASDDPEKVRALLARGAKPNAVTTAGYDALMMSALFQGNSRTASLLIGAGALVSPTRKTRYDATPLSLSVMTNDAETVELLLAKGANPKRALRLLGGAPNSPLVLAASFGNARIVRLLAKAGANIEETDPFGMTALSWAALSARTEAVAALLELGANRAHKDKFGMTPLDHTGAIDGLPRDTANLLASR